MADAPVPSDTTLCIPSTSGMLHDIVSSISPEVIGKIKRALTEGKLLEVISVVKETMQTVSKTPVSIAVTGDSGNGTSTFINALRDIGHDTEASAPTGVVRTTQTPACYSSSQLPNVELWDLPGMGTVAQSVEGYVQEMKFHEYHLIIIIASEQLSSNHMHLAKTIKRMGKRFYVVWTKLDRDLGTSTLSETQVLKNIRENIRENLQKGGVQGPPIFLLSSFEPLSHDFPKLRATLQKDVSYIRCCGPLKELSQICEKIIDERVNSMKETIGTENFVETPGVQDRDHLMESLKSFQLLFGVDDDSLQKVKESMEKPVVDSEMVRKKQDVQTYNQEGWTLSWVYDAALYSICSGLSYFPYVGDCGVYYCKCTEQRHLLRTAAMNTKTILRQILEDSII